MGRKKVSEMSTAEHERYMASKAKDLKRRREITAANPKRRKKSPMEKRVDTFEATGAIGNLKELWDKFREKECKRSCHLIAGYKDDENKKAQDIVLSANKCYIGPGCHCKDLQGEHPHRHILVILPEGLIAKQKSRNLNRILTKDVFPSTRWIKINCEFHLLNVIHYLHCKESMETKNHSTGLWEKGAHVHHDFFNSIDDLLHERIKCKSMRRFLHQTLKPTHVFRYCGCTTGLYHTESSAWIRTRPHPVKGDPAFVSEMKMTRYYQHRLRMFCNLAPVRDRPYNMVANKLTSEQVAEVDAFYKKTVERYAKEERPVNRVDPLPLVTPLPPKTAGMPLRY